MTAWLPSRPAAGQERGPLLFRESARPVRKRVALRIRHPELGHAFDHLEDESVDGTLHPEHVAVVPHLAVGKHPGHDRHHQQHGADVQRKQPMVVEQQRQAEHREETAYRGLHRGSRQHLADAADAVGAGGEIPGRESPKERRRQCDQPDPDGGLQALVDAPLDPQQGQSPYDEEDRVAEGEHHQRDQRRAPRRYVGAWNQLREHLPGQDRNQQRCNPAQRPHGQHGPEVLRTPVQGKPQHSRRVPCMVRQRWVERQPLGCDSGRAPAGDRDRRP